MDVIPGCLEFEGHTGRRRTAPADFVTQSQTTNPLTAAALIYALGAGIPAFAQDSPLSFPAGSLRSNCYSLVGLSTTHCNPTRKCGNAISLRCLTRFWYWAICVPAALRRSGSRLSGSLRNRTLIPRTRYSHFAPRGTPSS